MEEALATAQAYGLTEAQFWASTPYLTHIAIRAREDIEQKRVAGIGWWVARLAVEREPRLGSLSSYLEPPSAELAESESMAELARMGAGWGLSLEDIPEDE